MLCSVPHENHSTLLAQENGLRITGNLQDPASDCDLTWDNDVSGRFQAHLGALRESATYTVPLEQLFVWKVFTFSIGGQARPATT